MHHQYHQSHTTVAQFWWLLILVPPLYGLRSIGCANGSSSVVDMVFHVEYRVVVTIDSQLEFIQHFLPEKVLTFCGPCRVHNHFQDPNSFTLMDGNIALQVMIQSDIHGPYAGTLSSC